MGFVSATGAYDRPPRKEHARGKKSRCNSPPPRTSGPRKQIQREAGPLLLLSSARGRSTVKLKPKIFGQTGRQRRTEGLSAGRRQLRAGGLHGPLKLAGVTQRRTRNSPQRMSSAALEGYTTLDDGTPSKTRGSVNEYPWIEMVERASWISKRSRTRAAGPCSSFSSTCIVAHR